MSVSNSKSPKSIFDSQDSNDLKERQRLEELKRQAKVQQVKLDKRLNKQKILMGAFLGQVLASDGADEKIIQKYFATNFPSYLTRQSDKFLFKSMIESLGGDMGLGKEVDPFVANTKGSNQETTDQSVTVEDSKTINNQQSSFDTATNHGGQDSLLDDNSYSTYESNQDLRG
uniref:MobC n=1 Tax=Psychrobacter sp. DAB_AL60 TaxID=1028419 RepID=H9C6M7_9GAMM|nr:hypothetical protein [Psychrobacter sp. DAB_AL60]AFF18231.1 MobC [Psychrobacter sp. DAB_AL60]